jgi:pilus assembly protein FimV
MLFLLLQYFSKFKGGIVHNSKLKRITVALCMALMPISVFAAGLGKLNVMSGLGEPLKADIELISVTPEELNSISAAIASEEAYATQGIEKPASHNSIKVSIAKNTAGVPVLKLNSSQPISEPFLDMLIQVDWASGRLLREYTVLLDPPGYTGETDTSTQDNQTTQAPVVRPIGKSQKSQMANGTMNDGGVTSPSPGSKKTGKHFKKTKPSTTSETSGEEVVPAPVASGQDYVTEHGDTLAKIARDMKPEGVSLEQMLVGLYQTNPDAFQGKNMNRLKVGQIIRPPSEETLNTISRKDASSEIKVQTANWNSYRNKLAGIVTSAAPSDAEASTQSAGGKIKSAAEDKSMPAATGPKDVVKLSAGDATAAKASANNIKSLQDKITALQEEATAREKSVKEAQDRTASLEKQIADMQKLLAMKNGAMADMQKQAETRAAAEKNKPVEAASPTNQTKPPAEAVKEAKPAEQTTPAPAPSTADKNITKPVVKPAPAPAPEQGFLDGILNGLDLTTLLPAGGLLALLGGGWMYLRKKREKSLADFEQGIMTSGGLKANTVFGNTASASVDTGDTSFLTDFSQSANGGMIDTNDVDPIAEAEVYMAYGRDAQAEEILKDAISKEPKRYELHLKLLEMYAASKNISAFETISGELYTTLGAADPTWAKVAEIGIKLEPNNPLYQAGNSPTGSSDKATTEDKLDANDFSDTPLASEKDLDFSLDNNALTQGFAPTGTVSSGELTMDSQKLEDTVQQGATMEAPAQNLASTSDMSFEMEPKPELEAPTEMNEATTIDFDMGDLGSDESNSLKVEPIKTAAEEFGNTMPSLNIDTFQAPQFMPEVNETVDMQAGSSADFAHEAFALPKDDDAKEAGVLDISGLDTQPATEDLNNETNFSFSVNTIQPDALSLKDEGHAEANSFDLSTIDLSLDSKTAPNSSAETEPALSEKEPIEVETKLDLVKAYIEMDDKEGAKELLDEIMKEGGAGQRKRAEDLLAKLA